MSEISVALTSTRFLIATEYEFPDEIRYGNIPVCIAEMGIHSFGGPDEQFEHIISQSCLSMAKTIKINPENKSVFVGLNPDDENTGLVVYQEQGNSDCAKEFFSRWKETKTMIFEFGVAGKAMSFAINGLWKDDGWQSIEVGSEQKWHAIGSPAAKNKT